MGPALAPLPEAAASLAPETEEEAFAAAYAVAVAVDCATVLMMILTPGFAAEREERNAEAEEGESVTVALLTLVGAAEVRLAPLREAESEAPVGEESELEVAVALDIVESEVEVGAESGGRVKPAAKVALRVTIAAALGLDEGVKVMAVCAADPLSQVGVEPNDAEAFEAPTLGSAVELSDPMFPVVELVMEVGFELFEVQRGDDAEEFELEVESVQLFESTAAKDDP